MIARILLLILAALLVLPLADGTHPAEAKKKFKTVTKTFINDGQIAIPGTGTMGPANPYPATIHVGGFKRGKIKDVNLVLNDFSHSLSYDVDVLLVTGNVRDAFVMSDVGSNGAVAGLTLRLDDEAAAPLPTLPSQLTSGTFRPTNFAQHDDSDTFYALGSIPSGNVALSVFDGTNPNGTWHLFVQDDGISHVGAFAGGWSLEITAKVKKKRT